MGLETTAARHVRFSLSCGSIRLLWPFPTCFCNVRHGKVFASVPLFALYTTLTGIDSLQLLEYLSFNPHPWTTYSFMIHAAHTSIHFVMGITITHYLLIDLGNIFRNSKGRLDNQASALSINLFHNGRTFQPAGVNFRHILALHIPFGGHHNRWSWYWFPGKSIDLQWQRKQYSSSIWFRLSRGIWIPTIIE